MALKHKVIIGIVVLVSVVLYGLSQITEGEYYRRFSPDGQYSIYVAKHSYFNIELPFTSFEDNSGKVFLFDELNNEVVASSYIDMLSNINELFWNETAVYSKGHAVKIELPRPIDTRVIERYEESTTVHKTWNIYAKDKKYVVQKVSNRLTILNEKGDTILQNIRYIGVVLDGFQVLDNRNEIVYYDAALNQRSKPLQDTLINDVCDNVTTYR